MMQTAPDTVENGKNLKYSTKVTFGDGVQNIKEHQKKFRKYLHSAKK